MAKLVVDNLEDDVRNKLLNLASSHGHSMEQEVLDILRDAVMLPNTSDPNLEPNLGSRIAANFADGGLDQDIHEFRGQPVEPLTFEK